MQLFTILGPITEYSSVLADNVIARHALRTYCIVHDKLRAKPTSPKSCDYSELTILLVLVTMPQYTCLIITVALSHDEFSGERIMRTSLGRSSTRKFFSSASTIALLFIYLSKYPNIPLLFPNVM